MNKEQLIQHWKPICSDFKEVEHKGLCAIHRYLFTYGIVTNLTEHNYVDRWCYQTYEEAQIALKYYNGIGDPPGLWIKYKGLQGEWGNAHRSDFNKKYDTISPYYTPKTQDNENT